MASIKTAISVQEELFERAEKIADEMKISRSRLFNLALERFVLGYQNRKILEQINEAYSEHPDSDEQDRRRKMLRIQKNLIESEWT
jgi:metal-responsive CopG/Arc/MetJ family transcriptional regulator